MNGMEFKQFGMGIDKTRSYFDPSFWSLHALTVTPDFWMVFLKSLL